MKNFLVFSGLSLAFLMFLSFTYMSDQGDPWIVPDKYVKMKNPVAASASSIETGKALYVTHCQSCHGKKGKGDGTKAATLETECGDFTLASFKKQTDGSMFYKILEGRDDMPSYKKKISDPEDMWSVVNYIKALK